MAIAAIQNAAPVPLASAPRIGPGDSRKAVTAPAARGSNVAGMYHSARRSMRHDLARMTRMGTGTGVVGEASVGR